MTYSIKLPLPDGWTSEQDQYEEVQNAMITHLECQLKGPKGVEAAMDLYVGDMPDGTTAEDEAFANYADMIGFEDDDEDEENPIGKWKFQKKDAFGFSGMLEDNSVLLVMCVEIRKGALLIASVVATDDDGLSKWSKYLEEHLSVSQG